MYSSAPGADMKYRNGSVAIGNTLFGPSVFAPQAFAKRSVTQQCGVCLLVITTASVCVCLCMFTGDN